MYAAASVWDKEGSQSSSRRYYKFMIIKKRLLEFWNALLVLHGEPFEMRWPGRERSNLHERLVHAWFVIRNTQKALSELLLIRLRSWSACVRVSAGVRPAAAVGRVAAGPHRRITSLPRAQRPPQPARPATVRTSAHRPRHQGQPAHRAAQWHLETQRVSHRDFFVSSLNIAGLFFHGNAINFGFRFYPAFSFW